VDKVVKHNFIIIIIM